MIRLGTAWVAVPAAALALAAGWGCSHGPSLPGEMTFEGMALERATTWSHQGISGVVFVPPGERLPSASLQVGILASRKHASGVELHRWLMDEYRRSPTVQYHESTTADEACKVGLASAPSPRPFIALHVCRGASGIAACAEVDERMSDEDAGRCLTSGAGCWEELCAARWLATRASLVPILDDVLKR